MLTAEVMKYAESVTTSYKKESEWLARHLRQGKHAIPYDLVSLSLLRYRGERG